MRNRVLTQSLMVVTLVFAFSTTAYGQATRTWVSSVGNDADPCSRTAPCRTWAGAISKTAAGGEIDAVDPGGFGTVTITKSITIDGAAQLSSALASGTTGITVNAAATDVVILRNLSINGASSAMFPAFRGIRIIQAKAVHIENCNIFGFRGSPGRGIDINLASGATTNVYVKNTTISNNIAAAIAVLPSSGQPVVRVTVMDSFLNNNASGIFAGEGAQFTLIRTEMSGNSAAGIDAAGSVVPSVVHVDESTISFNARGIITNGGAAVRLARSGVYGNFTQGFQIVGGTINTYGDNYFGSNGANTGVLTSIAAQKQ